MGTGLCVDRDDFLEATKIESEEADADADALDNSITELKKELLAAVTQLKIAQTDLLSLIRTQLAEDENSSS
jgi:hypothetical protein